MLFGTAAHPAALLAAGRRGLRTPVRSAIRIARSIPGVPGPVRSSKVDLRRFRSGLHAVQGRAVRMTVRVDGEVWFKGLPTTLLAGNLGTVTGGLTVFPAASPTEGVLEVGVVTARGTWQWLRVFSRVARGHLERSPFIAVTHGKKMVVELGRKVPYELDGRGHALRPATRSA